MRFFNAKYIVVFLLPLFFLLNASLVHSSMPVVLKSIKQVNPQDTFPTPPFNKNMLFYIQRTHNINTIVYEVNYNKDSTINEKDPVKIYWIRYADNGEILPLSGIQKSFAYGVNVSAFDKEKKWFKLNIVSYKKTDIYLMNTKGSRYHAFVKINDKISLLKKIFFKTDGGSFWSPNVVYVELTGNDITTGKIVSERFKP